MAGWRLLELLLVVRDDSDDGQGRPQQAGGAGVEEGQRLQAAQRVQAGLACWDWDRTIQGEAGLVLGGGGGQGRKAGMRELLRDLLLPLRRGRQGRLPQGCGLNLLRGFLALLTLQELFSFKLCC